MDMTVVQSLFWGRMPVNEIDACSSRGEKKHRGGFGLCVKYLRGVTHAACCQGIDCAGGPAQAGTDGLAARTGGLPTESCCMC